MARTKQPVFSVKPEANAFILYRDNETLKTPRTMPVLVPTQKLADAIVAECVGQGDKLDLRKMPLMQMTLTSIDISAHHRSEVVDGIMRFGENELLCLRATEPADLVAEQQSVWTPYLDWCRDTFDADLRTGMGIAPVAQKPETLAAIRTYVESLGPFRLTGLSEACGTSGSLVLGLALATAYADPAHILASAELDGLWQAKKWGDDPAALARRADVARDLDMLANWFALLAGNG